jgi:hypothetical protein
MEGRKVGAFDRLNPSLLSGQAVSTLERGLVSCSAVMDDDPPFVDLGDADNLTRLIKLCACEVN